LTKLVSSKFPLAAQQPGQGMPGVIAQVPPLQPEGFLLVSAPRQEASRQAVQAASVIFYRGGSVSARFNLVLWLIQRPPPQRRTTKVINWKTTGNSKKLVNKVEVGLCRA
jgi:hypothetical protein